MRKAAVTGATGDPAHPVARFSGLENKPEQAPAEIVAYAASVKKLTNQEVSEQLEMATETAGSGVEMDDKTWWRIRVLLDELHWRLSGLE